MRRNNAYDFFLLQVVSCSLQHSAAVRHLARRTTRDDMASSSDGARDWQKTSEPRVDFDRRVGKWRLRMNYQVHSKLKKTHHHREIIVCQRSRGGSNATLVAAGLGTGGQRHEGQPAHTGRPTHTSGPTAKLRLSAYSRSDGYYSSARRVPFRAVCVFSSHFVFNFDCAACCLRLLDVVPVVSRRLHRLARCLRAALHRYSSGAARIRLCCCYTAVLCTCVRMVSVCLLYTSPSPRDATLSRMPSSA